MNRQYRRLIRVVPAGVVLVAAIAGPAVLAPVVPGAVAAIAGTGAARAETAAGGDFTFRRVRPPAAGQAQRITVQIDPEEQARRLAALPRVEPRRPDAEAGAAGGEDGAAGAAAAGLPFAWYWQKVSPGLGPVSDRFALAVAALDQGPQGQAVPAPRLQHMQELAGRFGTEILKATIGTRVSPALVLAVIGVESAGRVDAVSSAGAEGLMQLIPATARRFGVTDSMDPGQNIRGGVAYLDWLMKTFDNDPVLVLAAYNAGEGAVRSNLGVPPYAETRAYVPKVLASWQVAQGLCMTPPELVSDPCVFRIISAGG